MAAVVYGAATSGQITLNQEAAIQRYAKGYAVVATISPIKRQFSTGLCSVKAHKQIMVR